MQFESFSDFIAMGGHGLFVWLCYGAGLLVFVVLFITPKLKRKSIMAELYQKQNRQQAASVASFQVNALDSSENSD